jgi:hypothetical protein
VVFRQNVGPLQSKRGIQDIRIAGEMGKKNAASHRSMEKIAASHAITGTNLVKST